MKMRFYRYQFHWSNIAIRDFFSIFNFRLPIFLRPKIKRLGNLFWRCCSSRTFILFFFASPAPSIKPKSDWKMLRNSSALAVIAVSCTTTTDALKLNQRIRLQQRRKARTATGWAKSANEHSAAPSVQKEKEWYDYTPEATDHDLRASFEMFTESPFL